MMIGISGYRVYWPQQVGETLLPVHAPPWQPVAQRQHLNVNHLFICTATTLKG